MSLFCPAQALRGERSALAAAGRTAQLRRASVLRIKSLAERRFICPGRFNTGGWSRRRRRRNSKRKASQGDAFLFGASSGIRTPDTLLKRQVLCRLSYWVRSKKFCAEYEIKSYAVMAGTAGFAFQRESHGGSNNPPDYSQEPPFESKDSKSAIMAGTAGFEPANVGVKGRCLTAWRRPRIRLLETALP